MDTYFASPERADGKQFTAHIDSVTGNPVMTGLLHSISGLLAILNEQRQTVALNDSFMKMLGIDNPAEILGLRLGEVLQCVHAGEELAGCGTTKFCSTCGAAIAMVSSLSQEESVERMCALTANKAGTEIDMAFLVRSTPIRIDAKRFLLLFLQDITVQQQRAALERTFFHDIRNMLGGIVGAGALLSSDEYNPVFVEMIQQSSQRLLKEVEIQQCLFQGDQFSYHPELLVTTPRVVFKELQSFFTNHPVARAKKIAYSPSELTVPFKTDISLLLRVLCNMVTNALEATAHDGQVKVWFERSPVSVSFCVWNDAVIEENTALRLFQRNFTTKNEAGRGIGTYSMKLFGEKILGGQVSFTSRADEGTTFKITLPAATL
jgi:signal transduction histidine kinase